MKASAIADIIRGDLKTLFPDTNFTVNACDSSGARYIRVTVRKVPFQVLNSGKTFHSFSLFGFDNPVANDFYNNGIQLTHYGWALMARVAEYLILHTAKSTFVSLELGSPTNGYEVK